MKYQTYKITFITLDGNENKVLIDGFSKENARLRFEQDYMFESIKTIEEQQ